jgi:hypothetical protein
MTNITAWSISSIRVLNAAEKNDSFLGMKRGPLACKVLPVRLDRPV